MKAYIIDTTLRDGEQTPGVAFSGKEKLKIAGLLDQLGVHEIEAGTPSIGYEEQMAIKEIARSGFSFKTSCWCRAKSEDILGAAKLGTEAVNISFPVSDIQIETLGKTRKWVMTELGVIIRLAKNYFSYVTLGAQDATRAERPFLFEYIAKANEFGANRIRIADTVGIYDILETQLLFIELKEKFPKVEFEFHGHNDLGMGTANAIAALNSGADCVSATVNGLGERAGNSSLEEIIAYLYTKKNIQEFNTKVINELSKTVAEASGKPLSENKAINGVNAFKHESGIHASALLKNVKSYQVLDPADFGVKNSSLCFGKHSGKTSLIHFYNSMGLPIDEATAQLVLMQVKQMNSSMKTEVTNDILLALYSSITKRMENTKSNFKSSKIKLQKIYVANAHLSESPKGENRNKKRKVTILSNYKM